MIYSFSLIVPSKMSMNYVEGAFIMGMFILHCLFYNGYVIILIW